MVIPFAGGVNGKSQKERVVSGEWRVVGFFPTDKVLGCFNDGFLNEKKGFIRDWEYNILVR